MVVSSLTPLQCFDIHAHLVAFSEIEFLHQRFNVPSIDAVRSTKITNAIVTVLTLVQSSCTVAVFVRTLSGDLFPKPPASHEHGHHDVVTHLSPTFALGDDPESLSVHSHRHHVVMCPCVSCLSVPFLCCSICNSRLRDSHLLLLVLLNHCFL